jgi:hypothetical protein
MPLLQRTTFRAILAGLAVWSSGASGVAAQEVGGALAFGPWLVLPSLEAGVLVNDNVEASEDNAETDAALILQPQVLVSYDGRDLDWTTTAGARFDRYARLSGESESEYQAATGGSYVLSKSLSLDSWFSWRRAEEDATEADTDEERRFLYHDFGAQAGAQWEHYALNLEPTFSVFRRSFEADERADRNVTSYDTTLRAGVDISPTLEPYVEPGFTLRDFDEPDGAGLDQDSRTYRGEAGLAFEPNGLLRGSFGVGMLVQDFASAERDDLMGVQASARLDWNVTPLTDISLTLTRREETTFVETDDETSDSRIRTETELAVEHSLTRRITLESSARAQFDSYREIERTDTRLTFTLRGSYQMNQWAALTARIRHDRRMSQEGDDAFARNTLFVGVRSGF